MSYDAWLVLNRLVDCVWLRGGDHLTRNSAGKGSGMQNMSDAPVGSL